MTIQPNIETLISETRQYEFVDGLRDLQMAAIMAFFGAFAWFSLTLTGMRLFVRLILYLKDTFGSWATRLISLSVYFLLLVAISVGSLWLMRTVRRKWLWRESGWVKPLRMQVPRKVNILAAAIFLSGIAVSISLLIAGKVDESFVLRMLGAATGWGFGYTLIGMGREIGLIRYIWLGAVGGIASTILLFLPLTFGQTAILLNGAWALALGITGAIALRGSLTAIRQVNHGR